MPRNATLTQLQLDALKVLYDKNTWTYVGDVTSALNAPGHSVGCALRGLYVRGLADMRQGRERIKDTARTVFKRSYRITTKGKTFHCDQA